ncbi:MAG: electron transfer flavoprotein subunit beta/FixA family protein [Cytophagales bacterium]|nr:electron transfer flavoprotein subunit beta/FixA family protein [Cytophagales bacterium]
MKVLVCITHVPDTTAKVSFKENGTLFDESGVQFIIGPYDDYALSRAIDLKASHQARVVVLNVGTAASDPTIRKALATGADAAVRIDAEPVDSFFVANQIAQYAKDKDFDLILMGRESIDHNGGMVHGMVGELLEMPSVSPVMRLELDGKTALMDREIEGGKETIRLELPFVAGCQEPIAEWKIPNMRGIMTARSKPLDVLPVFEGAVAVQAVRYGKIEKKQLCKMFEPSQMEELVEALRGEAKVL